MEKTIVCEPKDLNKSVLGKKVYIYGAGWHAQRVHAFLKDSCIKVEAFVVSNKYDNPEVLDGIKIQRIEDNPSEYYSCLILAVQSSVQSQLAEYNIDELIILNHRIFNLLPKCLILSQTSSVAEKSVINNNVSIIADEGSSIIIDNYAVIGNRAQIVAKNNSIIHIDKDTEIGDDTLIFANNNTQIIICRNSGIGCNTLVKGEDHGEIKIGIGAGVANDVHIVVVGYSKVHLSNYVGVGKATNIHVKDSSFLSVGDNTKIARNADIGLEGKSTVFIACNDYFSMNCRIKANIQARITIDDNIVIEENGWLSAKRGGDIEIGKSSTFGKDLWLSCDNNHKIVIGNDSMISAYVKIETGDHKIYDKRTNTELKEERDINVGTHVWIGVAAILLSGADVGEGSIVGAKALLKKKVNKNVMCVGSHGKTIKENIFWDRDSIR